MWRSSGRRCGWETSSSCAATRSCPPMCFCWAPATPTAYVTSRRPRWTARPTWSRGRWSAASSTWWVVFVLRTIAFQVRFIWFDWWLSYWRKLNTLPMNRFRKVSMYSQINTANYRLMIFKTVWYCHKQELIISLLSAWMHSSVQQQNRLIFQWTE